MSTTDAATSRPTDPSDARPETERDGAPSGRSGSNQRGMRNYNERLIIDTVRRIGPVSKAQIARLTQLSAQTATVIVNRLIEEGYLRKLDSVRGKVGQPSVPIALNPEGALTYGVKVGRRSTDLMAVNFTHDVIASRSCRYDFPDPAMLVGWLKENLAAFDADLPAHLRERLMGVGLAAPTHLDGWEGLVGAPAGAMAQWRDFDLRAAVAHASGLPTFSLNDASAACLAELTLGEHAPNSTFLYLYVGTFVGGGLVLSGQLITGRSGNAGAIGSLPLTLLQSAQAPQQLLEVASFNRPDREAVRLGLGETAFESQPLAPEASAIFEAWAPEAARGLAMAIISAQAILDMDYAVLDGSLPAELRASLAKATQAALRGYNQQGIETPEIRIGRIGNDARAVGASILPLREIFAVDETAFIIPAEDRDRR